MRREPPVGAVVERTWPDGSGAQFKRVLLVGAADTGARWAMVGSDGTDLWTWADVLGRAEIDVGDGQPTVRMVSL